MKKRVAFLYLNVICMCLAIIAGVCCLTQNDTVVYCEEKSDFLVSSDAYSGDLTADEITYENGYMCVPYEAQGDDNWFALKGKADAYYTEMSFGDATNKGNHWQGDYTYNSIWWRKDFNPDGNSDAIAMWRAPYNGTVTFRGFIRKTFVAEQPSDGVTITVSQKTNVKTLTDTLYSKTFTDTFSLFVDKEINVVSGEMYFFSVGQNGDSAYDATEVMIKATFVEATDKGELASGSIEPIFSSENVEFLTDKQYYSIDNLDDYINMIDAQGENNVYMLYGDVVEGYRQMEKKNDGTNDYWSGNSLYNTIWWGIDYNPDGNDDAILMWRAPYNGKVKFQGKVSKDDMTGSDGIGIKVYKKLNASAEAKLLYEKDCTSAFCLYFSGVEYDISAGEMYFIAIDQLETSSYDGTRMYFKVIFEKDESNPGEVVGGIGDELVIDYLSYYGEEQGYNNWYYCYGTIDKYVLMDFKQSEKTLEPQYCGMEDWQGISAGNMTPGCNYACMRIYVADNSGEISVKGEIAKEEVGGDGANVKIYISGEEKFTYTFTGEADQSVKVKGLENIKVKAGDLVVYYVDSGANASNEMDNISFKTQIFWESVDADSTKIEDTSAYIHAVSSAELLGINVVEPELDQNEEYSGCNGSVGLGGLTVLVGLLCVMILIKREKQDND